MIVKISSRTTARLNYDAVLKVKLCQIIQNHSLVKELSDELNTITIAKIFAHHYNHFRFVDTFNDMYEFVIVAVFFWTLSTICCSLLAFQFGLAEIGSNKIQLMEILFMLLWSFGLIFSFSEFGEMVTNQFELFDYELWQQCDWQLFSIRFQRMFVLIMSNTQKLPQVQGYANTRCARTAFKQVREKKSSAVS